MECHSVYQLDSKAGLKSRSGWPAGNELNGIFVDLFHFYLFGHFYLSFDCVLLFVIFLVLILVLFSFLFLPFSKEREPILSWVGREVGNLGRIGKGRR